MSCTLCCDLQTSKIELQQIFLLFCSILYTSSLLTHFSKSSTYLTLRSHPPISPSDLTLLSHPPISPSYLTLLIHRSVSLILPLCPRYLTHPASDDTHFVSPFLLHPFILTLFLLFSLYSKSPQS